MPKWYEYIEDLHNIVHNNTWYNLNIKFYVVNYIKPN